MNMGSSKVIACVASVALSALSALSAKIHGVPYRGPILKLIKFTFFLWKYCCWHICKYYGQMCENIVNVLKFFFVIGFVFTGKLNLIYILINLVIGFLILTAFFLLGYFFYNPLFFSQLLFNLYQIVYRPII